MDNAAEPTAMRRCALAVAVLHDIDVVPAIDGMVLPGRPAHVLAFGTSMGGLISAMEAQQGAGHINGALTTCGIVAGAINLNNYQLDGEYALARLLAPPLAAPRPDRTAMVSSLAVTRYVPRPCGHACHDSHCTLHAGGILAPAGLTKTESIGPVLRNPQDLRLI